jgi:hypothetical protein
MRGIRVKCPDALQPPPPGLPGIPASQEVEAHPIPFPHLKIV